MGNREILVNLTKCLLQISTSSKGRVDVAIIFNGRSKLHCKVGGGSENIRD